MSTSLTFVGRKQRHSEFANLTDDEVAAIARDPKQPKAVRRKAQAEEKFRDTRNKGKQR